MATLQPDDMEGKQKFNIYSLLLSEDDDPEWDAIMDKELQELMQDPEMHDILAGVASGAGVITRLRSEESPHISLWRLREIALRPKASIDKTAQEHFLSCAFCEANRARMVSELWHPKLQTLCLYHTGKMGEADIEQIEAHLNVSRCERCRMVTLLLTWIDGLFDQDLFIRWRAATNSLEYLHELEVIATATPNWEQEFRQVRDHLRTKTEEALRNSPEQTSPRYLQEHSSHLPADSDTLRFSVHAYESMEGVRRELSPLS